jgi:hypothetical protein
MLRPRANKKGLLFPGVIRLGEFVCSYMYDHDASRIFFGFFGWAMLHDPAERIVEAANVSYNEPARSHPT